MSDVSDEELYEDGEEEELNIPEDDGGESMGEEEEVKEEEEEDKEPEPDPNPLTNDMMRDTLSMLSRIGDGLAHAYTRVDLRAKELTDINVLEKYIHLRHVILSGNNIKEISSLSSLTNLLTLNADKNRITGVQLETLPHLQVATLAHNKLKCMEGLAHPMLEKLNLAHNLIDRISGLEPTKMLSLTSLNLRANRLESMAGIYPKTLRELFLPANLLKSVEGLEGLENLQILHLRDNLIETLDGFGPSLRGLQYINIRGNQIANISEMKKLKDLPNLRALSLAENPLSEDDDYRMEVLVAMEVPQTLERIDKDPLEWEEVQEAKETLEQRKAEEVAAEAAAAEAAAEAAAQAAAEAVAQQPPPEVEITAEDGTTQSIPHHDHSEPLPPAPETSP